MTNRSDEPKFHVKEDAGILILCIRLEYLPLNKNNLTINYATNETSSSARKYYDVYLILHICHVVIHIKF